MKFIDNWRQAWRMLSVQLAAAAILFGVLPPDQQAALLGVLGLQPEHVPAALGALFILARLIGQPAISPPADGQP